MHISTSDGVTIDTTTNHPFYVEGEGWVAAGDLEVGDTLVTAEGNEVEVTDIELEKLAEPITVYNLEVADFHTYFVGEYGVLVHNNYRTDFFDEFPDEKGNVIVHHSIEQQVLKRFPGLFTVDEINDLNRLRGIPKEFNASVHLSTLRKAWNMFYNNVESGAVKATKENFEEFAKLLDILLSDFFV